MLGIILQKQHIWLAKNDQIIPKQRPYFIFCGDNFWVTDGSCRPFIKRTGRKIRNGVIVKKQSCSWVKVTAIWCPICGFWLADVLHLWQILTCTLHYVCTMYLSRWGWRVLLNKWDFFLKICVPWQYLSYFNSATTLFINNYSNYSQSAFLIFGRH